MRTFEYKPIGVVRNDFDQPVDYRQIKEKDSIIEIFDDYTDALLGIDEYDYLDIVFCFHKSESKLQTTTFNKPDVLRGVFASRSPKRPNLIGVTSVKLLKRKGNVLIVRGLDAINRTPVLDIKNSDTSLFAYEYDNNPIHQDKLKTTPRIDIRNDIHTNRTESLMIKAGQMHGHFCPGLAMGIMAATYAMNRMEAESDGMEDLLAITETNNCFSDGIQFVTGCTFGNNSLIYKDFGKTAFTLTKRDGKGIRLCAKPESQQVIRDAFPDFQNLYKKVVEEQNHEPELVAEFRKTAGKRAFGTLSIDLEKLFKIEEVQVEIPEYAKIVDSYNCDLCGESTMINRTRKTQDGKQMCLQCGSFEFGVLSGNGICCICKS